MRVGDDQQLQRLQRLRGFRHAGDGVAAMAEDQHALRVVALLHLVLGQQHGVEVAGRRDARRGLHLRRVEARAHILEGHAPHAAPVAPRGLVDAVIGRQVRDIEAEVRRALHVAVAAEDVRARAGAADIAGGQQQDRVGADIRRADRLLRGAHAPDQRRRLLRGEHLRDLAQLVTRHAGDTLDLGRRPLRDLGADLIHAVHALADEFLVLPAILEDVPEQAPHDGDIGARAHADIFRRVRGGAREARIHHDQLGAVPLLARQHMLQGDGVRLGGVAAHDHDGLGVADVVVAVRLGAVAPGVGHARDGGRMADARLMVDRVGAPEGSELAVQIGAFVGELGAAEPEDGIRAALAADLHHLVRDLAVGDVPADPLPLAVHQLHRELQAAVAMHQLAHRRTLGAMRAAIDRAFPGRLLAHPHAVLHFGGDGAADRAMGADVLDPLHRLAVVDHTRRRAGGLRARRREAADGREADTGEARLAEEGTTVETAGGQPCIGRGEALLRRAAFRALDQHLRFLPVLIRSDWCGRRPARRRRSAGSAPQGAAVHFPCAHRARGRCRPAAQAPA